MTKRVFVDFNGLRFTGRTHAGVVRDMKRYAWLVAVTKRDYMRDVAHRVAELTGGRAQLAVHSPAAFLASLVEFNFLKEE